VVAGKAGIECGNLGRTEHRRCLITEMESAGAADVVEGPIKKEAATWSEPDTYLYRSLTSTVPNLPHIFDVPHFKFISKGFENPCTPEIRPTHFYL